MIKAFKEKMVKLLEQTLMMGEITFMWSAWSLQAKNLILHPNLCMNTKEAQAQAKLFLQLKQIFVEICGTCPGLVKI